MRYRAENLLDLKMEILGSTTKVYKKPEVSPALKEVIITFVITIFFEYLFKIVFIEGTEFRVGSRSRYRN